MKKNLKVLGISHKTGEKNGKAYDFYIVHASYKDPSVEGEGVLELVAYDNEASSLTVGSSYDCWYSYFNCKYKLLAFLG